MKKVAIVGNPNSGKSTLFSKLTGVRQKISNFPGVTVEKKSGTLTLPSGEEIMLTDLPGTYSLFPNSQEERLVVNILTNPQDPNYPDLILYVADISQLERHLLLANQIGQLGIPMCFIANMSDLASASLEVSFLEKMLDVPVLVASAKKPEDVYLVKEFIGKNISGLTHHGQCSYSMSELENRITDEIMAKTGEKNRYRAKIMAHHIDWLDVMSTERLPVKDILQKAGFRNMESQVREVNYWYSKYLPVLQKMKSAPASTKSVLSGTDKIVTHPVFGPILFFAVMFCVFQAI